MATWTIDKQFSFCYGHRVWTQELINEYCESGDTSCKCRHLHGHEGLVHVFLESNCLERGMVTDFKHLGWLKNFLDTYVDHRFVIDHNDPMFKTMVSDLYNNIGSQDNVIFQNVVVPGTDHVAGQVVDLTNISSYANTPTYEVVEGYFVVNFVPTSENLSKWLFDCVDAKMKKIGVNTVRIDWFETPKSRSSYCG